MKGRAPADLRGDVDGAVVRGHDGVADRQADAGADAERLGGEERFEDPGQVVGADAATGIGHIDGDPVFGGVDPRGDGEPALVGVLHGLAGVDAQVDQDL